MPLNVDMYAAPVLCIAAKAHTASNATSHGMLPDNRLINSGTSVLSFTPVNVPFELKIHPATPWKMVNVNRISPMTSDEATTCCQRNARLVLFAKAHIENAGDAWIPISANMYVMHMIPVHGPPCDLPPSDTIWIDPGNAT